MNAPDDLRPREMSELARLIWPVEVEEQRDRQLVRQRAGSTGKGGGRKQFEQRLWTLRKLGLLDHAAARALLDAGRSSEDLVVEFKESSRITEEERTRVYEMRKARRRAREEAEAAAGTAA